MAFGGKISSRPSHRQTRRSAWSCTTVQRSLRCRVRGAALPCSCVYHGTSKYVICLRYMISWPMSVSLLLLTATTAAAAAATMPHAKKKHKAVLGTYSYVWRGTSFICSSTNSHSRQPTSQGSYCHTKIPRTRYYIAAQTVAAVSDHRRTKNAYVWQTSIYIT